MNIASHDFVWPPASSDGANPEVADPQPRAIRTLNTPTRPAGGPPSQPPGPSSHRLRHAAAPPRRDVANTRLPRAPLNRRGASIAIAALACVAAIEGVVIAIQFSETTAQTKAIAGILANTAAVARSAVVSSGGVRGMLGPPLAATAAHEVSSASSRDSAPPAPTTAARADTSSSSTGRANQKGRATPRARAAPTDEPPADPPSTAATSPSSGAYGLLYVNALPWANVSVDGHPAGQTPLGRIQLSPGVHQVRFTHPDYGEQVREVVIKADAPTRIGVDLRP